MKESTTDVTELAAITTKKTTKAAAGTMIVDSGATSHFGRSDGNFIPTSETSTKKVFLPDGSNIPATKKAKLPLDVLPSAAKEVHILPKLKHSLMSVGKLADEGYTTIFHPHQRGVTIHREGTVTIKQSCEPDLQGCRARSGLWEMVLDSQQNKPVVYKEQLNSVYDLPSTEMRIKYLHAAAGFPVKDTWIAAIKAGNYASWPGLTTKAVMRYFPESDETAKGHMKRQRQNVRSTKVAVKAVTDTTTEKNMPSNKELYLHVFNASDTMYTDQTGQFPITSMRRNKYIMIMYEVNGNYIDAEPFKNKTDEELTKTYQEMWLRLSSSEEEVTPTLHILDNEAPHGLKLAIKQNCKYQLAPPDTHRRNLAERSIQTFKHHFISILAGVDPSFPIKCWDRLVPQAILTLNLLRQANSMPEISAYAHRHGHFDYNKTPLAPLGCAVQIHNAVDRRTTWGEHSLDGWYVGTSQEHYRCHTVHVKQTNSERISDTVLFRHKYITDPFVKPEDRLMKAIGDLKHKLQRTNNVDGYKQLAALKKLDDIHQNRTEKTVKGKVSFTEHPKILRFNPEAPPEDIAAQTPRVTTYRRPVEPQQKGVARQPTGPAANTRSLARSRQHALSTMEHSLALANETVTEAWSELACAAVMDEHGNTLRYRQLMTHPKYKKEWSISSANEFGRLAQGVGGRVKGTDTIKFIPRSNVPNDRWKDITYAKFVCELKPNKTEIHRTRLTVGGNRINYPGDVGTPTGDLLLVKVLLNSVISTAHAKFMTMDIKNFYLNTPMTRYEYVRLKMDDVPDEIIKEYNLHEMAADGFIYLEIQKGMYGLPQAGILAQELLEKRLNKHGYFQSKLIPGLWTHETRPICFSLVVDDFGVKYVGEEHARHLAAVLKEHYEIEEDWSGSKYIGLTLDWDYEKRQVHLSMPSYVRKALEKFKHETPQRAQNSPYPYVPPKYGAKVQYADTPDDSTPLDKDAKKYIQAVAGTFLYYARAVDSTMLTALSAIATQQASPTEDTKRKVKHFLDYCASQEEAVITYRKSDMILSVHSDAGYLNERNARSRAGGHFFLSNDDQYPANNGAILNVAQIIKAVMSSAAEAELAALYINAREAVYIRQILHEMGHPQPRTPIQTDNSTAEGVINNKIQPKRTRAMDMRLHWLRDREAQRQFRFYWRPGGKNLADYWTKHHAPTHHKNVRGEFLTSRVNLRRETASHCHGMTAARVCQTSPMVRLQTTSLADDQRGASGPGRATARQPSILAARLRKMKEFFLCAERLCV